MAHEQFRWRPYLMTGVIVYVLAALVSAGVIGTAAFIRDPSYHSNAMAILGLSLLAAAPLLVIGIPVAVCLSVVIRWISLEPSVSALAAILISTAAGGLALLILVNFNLELLTPEGLAYLLPWPLFGAAFGSVAPLRPRDIARR